MSRQLLTSLLFVNSSASRIWPSCFEFAQPFATLVDVRRALPAEVPPQRPITSFDQDEEGHWRAQLLCGHRQHVRHDPPLITRKWVLSEAGRESMLGQLLTCAKCARLVIALQTPRLILRELKELDVPGLVELDSDPEVVRYLHQTAPPTHEKALAWVRSVTATFYEGMPGFGYWAVIERGTNEGDAGRFVGWFHLRPPRDAAPGERSVAEIGYRLHRDAWGKGFATEMSAAALASAFDSLGVLEIRASALVANRASTHVMEKLGMRLIREFVEPLTRAPAVEYSIDRARYLAARHHTQSERAAQSGNQS